MNLNRNRLLVSVAMLTMLFGVASAASAGGSSSGSQTSSASAYSGSSVEGDSYTAAGSHGGQASYATTIGGEVAGNVSNASIGKNGVTTDSVSNETGGSTSFTIGQFAGAGSEQTGSAFGGAKASTTYKEVPASNGHHSH
jgi:hypothetical protein